MAIADDPLPEDASLEDVQHSIFVRERIEKARKEASERKVVDEDEIERRMRRWLEE